MQNLMAKKPGKSAGIRIPNMDQVTKTVLARLTGRVGVLRLAAMQYDAYPPNPEERQESTSPQAAAECL
jgi:hypothetical protein